MKFCERCYEFTTNDINDICEDCIEDLEDFEEAEFVLSHSKISYTLDEAEEILNGADTRTKKSQG